MNNKLNDGVGKKIVEALKKQSEGELHEVSDIHEKVSAAFDGLIPNIEETVVEPEVVDNYEETTENQLDFSNTFSTDVFPEEKAAESFFEIESADDSINENAFNDFGVSSFVKEETVAPKYSPELSDLEMPSNIIILKKLISQLPSGVTRHTGAQIIKQTMEALGISMKNVLKEAQEVQDNLKESAKECQATIQEYKKQITMLEKQSQNYQKQYGALNDLISLFIQTTK